MEESAERNIQYIKRLLISRKLFIKIILITLCIFCTENLFSQKKATEYETYIVTSMQQYCFSNTDCQFNVVIPNVQPQDVQPVINDLPINVTLSSMKKEMDLSKNSSDAGTIIIFWLRFSAPGKYDLNHIKIRVKNKLYSVKFNTLTVYENLSTVQPQVTIEFTNTKAEQNKIFCKVGEHIRFTLYIKYAVQIIDCTWEVPEDSVFTEIKQYEMLTETPKGSDFSPKAEPVAIFDWQPLYEREYTLPKIILTTTSYSGGRVQITTPEYRVNVKSEVNPSNFMENRQANVFAYAFADVDENQKTVEEFQNQFKNPEKLVLLRQSERNSFPYSNVAKQRYEYEQAEGILNNIKEPSKPMLIVFLIMTLLSVILCIIFFVIKRNKIAMCWIIIFCISISFSLLQGVHLSYKYAIYIGGSVNSIPEVDTHAVVTIPAGSRVRIKKSTQKWVYIQYNDSFGWVENSAVYFIN